MKLLALYRQPADPEAFDQAYFNTHLPLIAQVPGLQRTVVTRVARTLMGESFYMVTEMHFSDADALKNGLRSPEMAEAGKNLNTFAEGLVTLLYGNEEQSAVNPTPGTTIPSSTSQV